MGRYALVTGLAVQQNDETLESQLISGTDSLGRGWDEEMAPTPQALVDSGHIILSHVERLRNGRAKPLIIALDGPSGSGKSSLAAWVAEALDVALVQSDDFFAAAILSAGWDARSPDQRASDCIDWRQLRHAVLEPLSAGQAAEWYPFDFAAGPRPNGSYSLQKESRRLEPRPVIVVDGAYSGRSELSDLVALSVLVDSPQEIRWNRLEQREDPEFLEQWHRRWDAAEAYYFTEVRPPSCFDIVVENS